MTDLPIETLVTDQGTQPRARLSDEHVARLAENYADGADLPPVEVYDVDGVGLVLVDGFHRVKAAESVGLDALPANVHTGTLRDALAASLKANREHDRAGLARTRADKRRAVETYLRDDEWRRRSDRMIAADVEVAPNTVRRIRAEMVSNVQIAQCSQRQTADGRTYPAKQKPDPADIIRRDYPLYHSALREWRYRPAKRETTLKQKLREAGVRFRRSGPDYRPAADPTALLRALRALDILDAVATREPDAMSHWRCWRDCYGSTGILGAAHVTPARTAAELRRWTDRVLAWLAWQDEHLAEIEPGEATSHVCGLDAAEAWGDWWHAAAMKDALAPDLSRLSNAQRARVSEAAGRMDFEAEPYEPLTDETGTLV